MHGVFKSPKWNTKALCKLLSSIVNIVSIQNLDKNVLYSPTKSRLQVVQPLRSLSQASGTAFLWPLVCTLNHLGRNIKFCGSLFEIIVFCMPLLCKADAWQKLSPTRHEPTPSQGTNQDSVWKKHASIYTNGFVWKCSVPLHPMVNCWSLSLLNGYFIGNIPHFQTNPNVKHYTTRCNDTSLNLPGSSAKSV